MDATARIKNLSIALEALSRIPKSESLSEDIEKLLWKEINEAQEEKEQTRYIRKSPIIPTSDDDIHF